MFTGQRASLTRRLRSRRAWIAAVLIGSMLVSAPSRAEITDEPIELVDFGELSDAPFKGDIHLSDNGRYLTLSVSTGANADFFHVDLDTGVVTDVVLDRAEPSEDGKSVVGEVYVFNGDGKLFREDLVTHELEPLVPAEADAVAAAEFPSWTFDFVTLSADGRYVLFSGLSPGGFRFEAFVWDLDEDRFATPRSGLPREEQSTGLFKLNVRDGRHTLEYRSFDVVGSPYATYEILDLGTGRHTVIHPPDSWSPIRGQWHISPDLEWIVFPSDKANVVPGLSARNRYYRYNRTTGKTTEIPFDYADVLWPIRVFDSGAIGFPAVDDAGEEHIYWWSGRGVPVQLLRSFDGGELDKGLGIHQFSWDFSASGESVVIRSEATNIVEGIDPSSFIDRVYRIGSSTESPDVRVVSGGAKAQAPAQRCGADGC